jgi:hypothetical protein
MKSVIDETLIILIKKQNTPMKKTSIALFVLVAGIIMSSCGFTTLCPTYAKKEKKDVKTVNTVRI